MKKSLNRVEIKKEAKKLLDGKTWILLLCNLCFLGIIVIIGGAVFCVPNPLEKLLTNLIYGKGFSVIDLSIITIDVEWLCWGIFMFIRSIIFVALIFPFFICLSTVPLAIVYNEKINVAKIFAPISKSRYFVEYAIAGVQKYLCTILWTLLLFFPGIMARYRYGLIKYIFSESNELTAGEAISKSKKITNGNKGQLFTLDLSFIGWFLFGIVTCGVGLCFVIGYYQIVTAMYYKKISEESEVSGEMQ